MREVKIYNSMTNKIEVLKTLEEGEVSMYVCGPTVYSYVHIGNMRPVITFDTFRRFLTYIGYSVVYISNITDVDDKIINQAIKEGTTEYAIATKYADNYFMCCNKVNVLRPTYTPKVTQTMDQIIEFIGDLIKLGYAYETDGDVYFRVSKIEDYGKLGNFKIDDLKVGARIEENNKKENPLDFALWKKTDIGVKWESPWSLGRPGWHTECVVMINDHYDNARIDIHGGGFDLKFPHHENEIAQAKACFGNEIATYWMHNGFINIDNEKMSKSLGNVILAKDLLEKYEGIVIRLVMLNSYYRAPLNFTEEGLIAANKEKDKIIRALRQADVKLKLNHIKDSSVVVNELMDPFLEQMANDLNTPNALTELYKAIKELNTLVRTNDLNKLADVFNTVLDMMYVLGLDYQRAVVTKQDEKLFAAWDEAKKNKDFAKADEIRKKLVKHELV